MIRRLFSPLWLAAAFFILLPNVVEAQSKSRTSLDRQVQRCFDNADYAAAVTLIEEHLKHAPNDVTMLYNLACAHSRLNDADAAAAALLRAFKNGFDNLEHMRQDPDLANLRAHPIYKTILEQADRAAVQHTRNAQSHWRATYGDKDYRYETDDSRRIHYATALDETSHTEMSEMLARQADHLRQMLFGEFPNYHVLIAVPTPADADKFFNNDDSVGGIYQHNLRRLVARDIGASLRHEFFHALHFGHMEKLGQPHPLWIQEGLASLYEDYELNETGLIRFLPNERQLIAQARARAGRLHKWNDLFAMSATEFMAKAPQLYPTVRAIFEYVADHDKLQEWYRAYTDNFREDRTGAKAFELTFGKTIPEIEKDWRRWVIARPTVNLRLRADSAALGIRSDDRSTNDGVMITEILRGSGAAHAGLKRGDIIVAVDGRSTRSLMELRRIIASCNVGDEVEVRVRRRGEYITATVILRPVSES